MGTGDDPGDYPGGRDSEDFVPGPLRAGASFREIATATNTTDDHADELDMVAVEEDKDGAVDRKTELRGQNTRHGANTKDRPRLRRRPTDDLLSEWSWLSEESPLMSRKSESEWILERLSAALVRELNRQRKGSRRHPPISMKHLTRSRKLSEKAEDLQAV